MLQIPPHTLSCFPSPMSIQSSLPLTNVVTGSFPASPSPDPNYRENRAWKYYGYPSFCDFMASDNDLFLLRRFGHLNARVLLNLQYRISSLEKELRRLDEECRNDPSPKVRSDSFEYDKNADPSGSQYQRALLINDLYPLLKQ
ncbi:hypothetical protein EJ08DRAFT_471336 [Tothia fuscella]|uniref:DUF6594 domain-containing protein n=1 Tax=Tothia fuscella TaxID=1048955 RepID=A0A9P4NZL1_9PEZI|nr:hypothetical protein EJ08DRAFT_471336 [Tothia fuscella]